VELFVAYMAGVSLTDAAMCMNFRVFVNLSTGYWYCTLFFSHWDFLLCKHNCIPYAWMENFGWGL